MKKLVSLCIITLLAAFCFGNEKLKDWNFFVEPAVKTDFGKIDELLYINQTTSALTSQLNWEYFPLAEAGAKGGFNYKNLNLTAEAFYIMPIVCGRLYDLDYISAGTVTENLASFDLFSTGGAEAKLNLDYAFTLPHNFKIAPALNVLYFYKSFRGKNGIEKKGNGHSYDSQYATTVHVKDLKYYQHYLGLFTGLKVFYNYKNFDFNLSLYAAPYNYIFACDTHTSSGEDTLYYMWFTSFFTDYSCTAQVLYKINSLVTLDFTGDFLYSSEKRGKGTFPFNGNVNGCHFFDVLVSAGCRFNL